LTTSPRTPEKMIPELNLLVKHFSGQRWNEASQKAFMEVLRKEHFFSGKGKKNPAFSARDRINRAPKSLGFVTLSPVVAITPAGQRLISSQRKEEVFLRQMLKFQVPSPYHVPSDKAATFCVKPYLEIFRKMLEDSYRAGYDPNPEQVRRFFEHSNELVGVCKDEREWYAEMKKSAMSWLA